MDPALSQSEQLLPLLPPKSFEKPFSGAHVYLSANSRLGVPAPVPICEPEFPAANQQNALGFPVNVRPTRVRSRCTGQIRDSETGVDFFNARYFTGALGRFNSPDPMNAGGDVTDPQTWNGYAYVRGNPLALVDPSGMDGCDAQLGDTTGIVNDPPRQGDQGLSGGGGLGIFAGNPVPVNCPGCNVTVNGGGYDPLDPEPATTPFCLDCGFFTFFTTGWAIGTVPTRPWTGGAQNSQLLTNPPNNGTPCVQPSIPQRLITSGLSLLAKTFNKTFGYGTGGSAGAGRVPIAVNFAVSMQFVAAPDGTVGKQFSYTPNTASYFSAGTTGAGALFGLQFSRSNAQSIGDLAGPGIDIGGVLADGVGVGGDLSLGSSGGRLIYQGTLTLGFGAGGKGAAGVLTQTSVTPFCQGG